MNKQTFSHYGWIAIVTLIIAILIGLSTPFVSSIKNNFISITNRLGDEAKAAMDVIDIQGGNGKEFESLGPVVYTVSSPMSRNSANPDYTDSSNYLVSGSLADVTVVKTLEVNGDDVAPNVDGSWATTIELSTNIATPVTIEITDVFGETVSDTRYVMHTETIDYAVILDNASGAADDNMPMVFVKTHIPIVAGGTYVSNKYGELTVAAVYTDFIEDHFESGNAPWYTDYAETITSVSFDDTVTPSSIAYWFYGCTSLTDISTIPGTVTDMSGAFAGCASLVNAPVIPRGVINMNGAFSGCTSLINAPTIPYGVVNMSGAFTGCTSLKTAPVIPETVTDISSTFEDCVALNSVPSLPSGILTMKRTFAGCTSLTSIPNFPATVANLSGVFSCCTRMTSVPTIPNSVIDLSNAFYKCSSLADAPEIPESVTNMYCTFLGCTSITTPPVLPDSITNMKYVFYGCTALTTAPAIPYKVTDISNAFYGCTSLVSAPVIPSNVKVMNRTFFECASLTGNVEINTNPISYYGCFYGTTHPIKIIGSCSEAVRIELVKTADQDNVSY